VKCSSKEPSIGSFPARAVVAGTATAEANANGFGLRSYWGARTVASMRASSNNRWRGP